MDPGSEATGTEGKRSDFDERDRLKRNADAAQRYRQRVKAERARVAAPLTSALQKCGRPPTVKPSLRTAQRRLRDLESRIAQVTGAGKRRMQGTRGAHGTQMAGHTEGTRDANGTMGALNTKRFEDLVMKACRFCPDSEAARVGFAIPSGVVHFKLMKAWYTFPGLVLRRSELPGAGAGVFAAQFIQRNDFVCEYGGAVITRADADKLHKTRDDTHVRTLGRSAEYALDGRITESMPIEKYLVGHRVGSFLNGPGPDKTVAANCKYVLIQDPGHAVACEVPGDKIMMVDTRCYLRALRDIHAGEELLVSYGPGYQAFHLSGT